MSNITTLDDHRPTIRVSLDIPREVFERLKERAEQINHMTHNPGKPRTAESLMVDQIVLASEEADFRDEIPF